MPGISAPLSIPTPSHRNRHPNHLETPSAPRRLMGSVGRARGPRSTQASTLVSLARDNRSARPDFARHSGAQPRARAVRAGTGQGSCRAVEWRVAKHSAQGAHSPSPQQSYEVTDDITSFQGSADVPTPSSKDQYRWAYARRLALWRAVRADGASAVDLGDPSATPLFVGLTHCKKVITCHDPNPGALSSAVLRPQGCASRSVSPSRSVVTVRQIW